MDRAALLAIAVAFFLSFFGTAVARRLAVMTGYIAHPSSDRLHRQPTPLLGGVGIMLGILLPSLLALALGNIWLSNGAPTRIATQISIHLGGLAARTPMALGILAGALGMHILGLVDDKKKLGALLKLALQILICTLVVWLCDVRLLQLLGRPASMTLTILWLVTITNSFNFLDNMDGLSAGVATICTASLMVAAIASGQIFVGAWLCLLLGSCLGFLVHNFPPAKIFMGDAGSLVIGYFIAVLSVLTTYYHGESGRALWFNGALTPLVALAVPLYDTVSVIVLRLQERRNPMIGDTRHFSHRLLRRGMSTRKAVLTIYLATAATAIGATVLPHVDTAGAVLILGQALSVVLMIALLESTESKGKA
jgi:UDP-GlcNAc:undecaprenyl-phosphate GlcNAc-1-phosphate transferase